MKLLHQLKRDERGAAAIEMAIVLPVLILFIYGIFQVGILYQANAGMQHALGEGARFAVLCKPVTGRLQRCDRCGNQDQDELGRIRHKARGRSRIPAPTTVNRVMTLTVNYIAADELPVLPGPTVRLVTEESGLSARPLRLRPRLPDQAAGALARAAKKAVMACLTSSD